MTNKYRGYESPQFRDRSAAPAVIGVEILPGVGKLVLGGDIMKYEIHTLNE